MADINDELSPLDKIRLVESEMARRITAARVAAEQNLALTRSQAEKLKAEARETGMKEGQALYQQHIVKASEEARSITAQSQRQAAEVRRKGNQRMDAAVHHAVEVVLGRRDEAGVR